MGLAENIRTLRQRKGVSQRQMARDLGISPSIVNCYEQGTRRPSFDVLCELTQYLGVHLTDLVSDTAPALYPANVLPMPDTVRLPLLGTIACGKPILAEQNIEDWIDVPANARGDFVLRCRGDSMKEARILDGDLVCIRQQPDVDDGQIAAVLLDDEATLKRVYHLPSGGLVLQPANSAYSPMYVGPGTEVRVLGLATHFISKLI